MAYEPKEFPFALASLSVSVRKGKEVKIPFHFAQYLYYLSSVSRADILFIDKKKDMGESRK